MGKNFTLTSKVGGSINTESHIGGGAGVRGTDGWNGQAGSSPRGRCVTSPSREGCKSASVGPGKVSCAQRRAAVAGELFGQATVRWGVLSVYENKSVGKVLDGGHEGRIGRG